MRASSRPIRWVALVALIGAAPLARADYKDSYSRGLEAVRSGNWSDVQKYMSDALKEHAEPATRIRLYGQRWEPYVPQYYLGLAAFTTGDCATAQRYWGDAASRAVVAQLPGLQGQQETGTAECATRLAKATKPVTAPTPTKEVASTTPAVAKPDVGATKPVAATMPNVASSTPVPTPPATAKPAPPVVAKTTPAPPPVVAVAKPAAPAGGAELRQLLNDYLAGRYENALRVDPKSLDDVHARAHALLVRAAAAYTLATVRGEKDDGALLNQARADIVALRALDARLAPDAALFSPRFRAFFDRARG